MEMHRFPLPSALREQASRAIDPCWQASCVGAAAVASRPHGAHAAVDAIAVRA